MSNTRKPSRTQIDRGIAQELAGLRAELLVQGEALLELQRALEGAMKLTAEAVMETRGDVGLESIPKAYEGLLEELDDRGDREPVEGGDGGGAEEEP